MEVAVDVQQTPNVERTQRAVQRGLSGGCGKQHIVNRQPLHIEVEV